MKLFDFDKLVNTLTGYIETRIELIKIDAREGLAVAITKIIVVAILGLMGFFILFFMFLGISALLNEVMQSTYWGYFMSAGFFALLLTVVLLIRDRLASRVRQLIEEVEEVLEEIEEETEQENV